VPGADPDAAAVEPVRAVRRCRSPLTRYRAWYD
jgi:hypothetical protein